MSPINDMRRIANFGKNHPRNVKLIWIQAVLCTGDTKAFMAILEILMKWRSSSWITITSDKECQHHYIMVRTEMDWVSRMSGMQRLKVMDIWRYTLLRLKLPLKIFISLQLVDLLALDEARHINDAIHHIMWIKLLYKRTLVSCKCVYNGSCDVMQSWRYI